MSNEWMNESVNRKNEYSVNESKLTSIHSTRVGVWTSSSKKDVSST